MNQLATEGKKSLMVVYLRTILSRQAFVFSLYRFFFSLFCGFGWVCLGFFPIFSSSPSSNKLFPKESYSTNLLQFRILQASTKYF